MSKASAEDQTKHARVWMVMNPCQGGKVLLRVAAIVLVAVGLAVLAAAPTVGQTEAASAAQTVPTTQSARPSFAAWVKGLRAEAMERGISPSLFDEAFQGVSPVQRILELDQSQPELKATAADYMASRLNEQRIRRGQEIMANSAEILAAISQDFKVEPQFIVALWGVETDYGANRLNQNAVRSLATLAYGGRRAAYFRKELLDCLWIIQNRRIDPASLKSSWAGALGQIQFMPSSYLAKASTRDGRRPPAAWPDIWDNQGDMLASIANYLALTGWRPGLGWGEEVEPPTSPALLGLVGIANQKTLAEWRTLGVVAMARPGNPALSDGTVMASLIRARDQDGPYYLVTENFRHILKWNRSLVFAIVVGRLADQLANPDRTQQREE
ncbi:MAG: lytic murein transglycosylase [Alphaproteobacteria bacterium]|nr:lytic murein transglycosylase [Alphaproteobacteria bacterium]